MTIALNPATETINMPKSLDEAYRMIYGEIQEDAPIIRIKKWFDFSSNNNDE